MNLREKKRGKERNGAQGPRNTGGGPFGGAKCKEKRKNLPFLKQVKRKQNLAVERRGFRPRRSPKARKLKVII